MRLLRPSALLLACLMPAPLRAQGMELGWKLGLVRSTVIRAGQPSFQPVTRGTGTFFMMFPLSPHFALQPQLSYTGKGLTLPGELKMVMDYVEVPVALRVQLRWGGVRPHVLLGPSLAILRSCTMAVLQGYKPGEYDACFYMGEKLRPVDVLATAGAGLDLGNRERWFHAEVFWERSLHGLASAGGPPDPSRAVGFLIGIAFPPNFVAPGSKHRHPTHGSPARAPRTPPGDPSRRHDASVAPGPGAPRTDRASGLAAGGRGSWYGP